MCRSFIYFAALALFLGSCTVESETIDESDVPDQDSTSTPGDDVTDLPDIGDAEAADADVQIVDTSDTAPTPVDIADVLSSDSTPLDTTPDADSVGEVEPPHNHPNRLWVPPGIGCMAQVGFC